MDEPTTWPMQRIQLHPGKSSGSMPKIIALLASVEFIYEERLDCAKDNGSGSFNSSMRSSMLSGILDSI